MCPFISSLLNAKSGEKLSDQRKKSRCSHILCVFNSTLQAARTLQTEMIRCPRKHVRTAEKSFENKPNTCSARDWFRVRFHRRGEEDASVAEGNESSIMLSFRSTDGSKLKLFLFFKKKYLLVVNNRLLTQTERNIVYVDIGNEWVSFANETNTRKNRIVERFRQLSTKIAM